MKELIDVLEILENQHAEIDQLIEQLRAGGDREELFPALADRVMAHMATEEKIFYPAAADDRTSEVLQIAIEDHRALTRLVTDMLELDPVAQADELDDQLVILAEIWAQHAHEDEEGKLFPLLQDLLDTEQRAALGNEVLAMYEDLTEAEPRTHIEEHVEMPTA
jgi:hypothetical protein